jgi:hypothetical protein
MPVGALDATFSRRTMACLGDLFHYIDCIHAARPGGLGSFSIETLWSATVRPICFLLQQRRKRPNIVPSKKQLSADLKSGVRVAARMTALGQEQTFPGQVPIQ